MQYAISGSNSALVEKYTIENVGIPSMVLMERAAISVADVIISKAEINDRVAIICGVGNNGADGIAIARLLHSEGIETCAFIIGNIDKATDEFKQQLDIFWAIGGIIRQPKMAEELEFVLNANFIVDALFGTGLSREVEGVYAGIIQFINSCRACIVSVDIPSGVNSNTGEIMGCAVQADITVTFGMLKVGMVLFPGADCTGEVIVSDIGIPVVAYDRYTYYGITEAPDINIIPRRRDDSNKSDFGKILIIAGSDNMTGAALMACKACMRMGAGMVKLLTTNECAKIVREALPEAMVSVFDEYNYLKVILDSLKWCDVIVAGPGMGINQTNHLILKEVLACKKPVIIDADAINCISESELLKSLLHRGVCITPHLGEMSRLARKSIETISKNLIKTAQDIANEYNINVVLKSARTVITDGEYTFINTSGNNGMATAGSGDVLSGILGAMWGGYFNKNSDFNKYLDSRIIVVSIAVFLHGLAGDLAAAKKSKTSMIATDMIDELIEINKKWEEGLLNEFNK